MMHKIEANDPLARGADGHAENIRKLKELFPELVTEGPEGLAVNVDVLKGLVGDSTVTDAQEKFGLNWHGKRLARQLALTPSLGTLRPCKDESVDWDTTQNLMIEGDNLEVLKLLKKSYAGKVKLIYVDPPYNTGKDFVYPDDFRDGIANYKRVTEQTQTSNPETSGRFHTDWLNMMYPRLKLARELLREDGVVFISIDDRELQNIRSMCAEVFGEESLVATVAVVNNLKGRNDKKHIAPCHEYVVVLTGPKFRSYGLALTPEQKAAFNLVDDTGQRYLLRDLRKRGGPDRREDRPNMYFPIYWNPQTGSCDLVRKTASDTEIVPLRGDGTDGRWRWGREKVAIYLNWLHARRSERTGRLDVEHRIYLDPSIQLNAADEDEEEDEDEAEEVQRTSKPKSIWLGGEFSSDSGKRALKALLPGEAFDFPKAIAFLRTCVQMGSSGDEIVLDMFAGSGALGDAVLQQNAVDSGRRRFFLIQLPQTLDPKEKSQKGPADVCDTLGKPRTIAELTKERLRRAAAKIRTENPLFAGDLGFRVFKLDSTNIAAWDPKPADLGGAIEQSLDHLKTERGDDDVLYEILLKHGLDLSLPIAERQVAGKTVYSVGAGTLLACLDRRITQADAEPLALGMIAWLQEMWPDAKDLQRERLCVFRDAAFAGDDVAKTNLAAILEQNGLADVRSL